MLAEDVKLVKRGQSLTIKDGQNSVKWVIFSYLLHLKDADKVKIDWEHTETRWINPENIVNYETVPKLKETLDQVIG
ncbi:hypothetical protein ACFLW3_02290 [Chloroflexota bacterium]